MRWFRRPFKHSYQDGEHLITTRICTSYGNGDTQEAAIIDLLDTLAHDYAWLVDSQDKLAPGLLKELQGLTNFFTGRN